MSRSGKASPPESRSLFSDAHPVAPSSGVHIANIDGASRGNPGPAAYAVVIRDPAGHVVFELAKRLGRETNNVAEYYALLAALDYAMRQGIGALRIRSDSELLVRQMQGRYKVKSADLKPLHERASKLSRQLDYFAIEHVRRNLNRDADALANIALDSGPVSNASAHRAEAASQTAGEASSKVGALRIRARFRNGVLVPLEPLKLPDDSEVLLDLRISKHE